ncbi:MAG: TetR/AcrR family transcriptional regulator [Actinomycetota bacterium]
MTPATDMDDAGVADSADRSDPIERGGRSPSVSADAVVDAAEVLLAEAGFDGMSVRRIADAVGVSRQVVYTHFGGMDGLLDELHRRLSQRLIDAATSVSEPTGTTAHLLAATAGYRSVARRWPDAYQLVFERPVADYSIGPDAERFGLESFGHVVDAAEAWLRVTAEVGRPRRSDAIDLARAVWSTAHGFVVLERVGFADPSDTDRLCDRAIRAILAGWHA